MGTEPSYLKVNNEYGAFFAWRRGGYYYSASREGWRSGARSVYASISLLRSHYEIGCYVCGVVDAAARGHDRTVRARRRGCRENAAGGRTRRMGLYLP